MGDSDSSRKLAERLSYLELRNNVLMEEALKAKTEKRYVEGEVERGPNRFSNKEASDDWQNGLPYDSVSVQFPFADSQLGTAGRQDRTGSSPSSPCPGEC